MSVATAPNGTTSSPALSSSGAPIETAEGGSCPFSRWGWLLAALACLVLGYLVCWQRGLHPDDFTLKYSAQDVATGAPRSLLARKRIITYPARIASIWLTSLCCQCLPQGELVVRLLLALGVGANALLLGWLLYRVLSSRLAALVAGWLFLMPLYAAECLLWISAGPQYIGGVTFALLFLHCCWSALTVPGGEARWLFGAVLAWVTMLLFNEANLSAAGFIPVLAVVCLGRPGAGRPRVLLRRSLVLMLLITSVCGLFYLLVYRTGLHRKGPMDRGGMDLSWAHIQAFTALHLERLHGMVLTASWGRRMIAEPWDLGLHELRHSAPAAALFAVAGLLVLGTVLTWKDRPTGRLPDWRELLVLLASLAWVVGSVLIPAVLVKRQQLEYRLLYWPSAWAAVAAAVFVALLARLVHHPLWQRSLVLLTGGILLFDTVGMLGFSRAYVARWERDRHQLESLVQAVPASALPRSPRVIVAACEEQLFGPGFPRCDVLTAYLTGLFEAPWGAEAALRLAYHRDDVKVSASNRWGGPLHFRYRPAAGDAEPMLAFQTAGGANRADVPLSQALVFAYREHTLRVARQLILRRPDGRQTIVPLPLGQELARRGTPTADLVVPAD